MPEQPQRAGTEEFARWQLLAEAATQGAFSKLRSPWHDGITIEPLYPRRRDTRSLSNRGGARWSVVQSITDPDPERAGAQAEAEIAGGAAGVALHFADGPLAEDAGLPAESGVLEEVLGGLDLAGVHLRLEPHPDAPSTADRLAALVARQGVAPERAHVRFGLDPFSTAAFAGGGGADAAAWTAAFGRLRRAGFSSGLVELDGRLFHEAGASAAQELAVVLAAAAEWLRLLQPAGPGDVLASMGASIAVDREQFPSTAKLRALRLLWRHLLDACGAPAIPLHVHAESSRRMLVRTDVHGNLLRNTIAAFAAACGGADSISVLPHDHGADQEGSDARRLARNIQHLLAEESQIWRFADPGAGSGSLEALTEMIASRAWDAFHEIEAEGGLRSSLGTEALQARIADTREELVTEVREGRVPLVGATVYRMADAADAPRRHAKNVDSHRLVPVRLEALAEGPVG